MKNLLVPIVVFPLLALAGCTSVSSNYVGAITQPEKTKVFVCHGFDCTYKTAYWINEADNSAFAAIMADGVESAEAERQAISRAVMYFEDRSAATIGVRDGPKSTIGQSRDKGQMDCIDESTNTRTLLLYLRKNGWLNHHKVESNVSRGFFVDGRYPHSTAVLRGVDGERWAVDSWFEPAGGAPDIMPLSTWRTYGVMGARGALGS